MADEIHYSAIIRVGFYSTDVGTDWYNGYNFFNFTQNGPPPAFWCSDSSESCPTLAALQGRITAAP